MAALAEPFSHIPAVIRDLREFRARDLEPLLRAEEQEWLQALDWDFGSSGDLVRKFVDMGNLNGAALVNSAGLIGYTYFVFEDGKGLLGDLYVTAEYRTPHHESLLIDSAMNQIGEIGGVPRVEGQIMMLSAPLERPGRYWKVFETFKRSFLSIPLPASVKINRQDNILLQPWLPAYQEQAAHLIPATYRGHVDSRINDQYLTLNGARKFLHNIVQFPGCGVFYEPASFAAFNRRDGRLCGMVLSSLVSGTSGHITQVCVHPDFQGAGLGRHLLAQALTALERTQCRTVSLTVTTENRGARMLYERLGFRTIKKFEAYVWAP